MGLILLNGTAYSGYDEPPCIYSEEEREVGVWIDGKPVYEKTIFLGDLVFDTNWHTVPHNILNLDKIVHLHGIFMDLDNKEFYHIPVYRPNTQYGVVIAVLDDDVRYMNNLLDGSSKKCYATLQYTKTTDVSGSGKWISNGSLAHHYSTNEQVVGTWIDGKPVYEKTYFLDKFMVDQTWTTSNFVEPIDKVIKADLIDEYNQHFTCEIGLSETQTSGYFSVEISTRYPSSSNRRFDYLIIQYTKTTD